MKVQAIRSLLIGTKRHQPGDVFDMDKEKVKLAIISKFVKPVKEEKHGKK